MKRRANQLKKVVRVLADDGGGRVMIIQASEETGDTLRPTSMNSCHCKDQPEERRKTIWGLIPPSPLVSSCGVEEQLEGLSLSKSRQPH
jgi:hypothetical protein